MNLVFGGLDRCSAGSTDGGGGGGGLAVIGNRGGGRLGGADVTPIEPLGGGAEPLRAIASGPRRMSSRALPAAKTRR